MLTRSALAALTALLLMAVPAAAAIPKAGSKWAGTIKGIEKGETGTVSFKIVKRKGKLYAKGAVSVRTSCSRLNPADESERIYTPGPTVKIRFNSKLSGGSVPLKPKTDSKGISRAVNLAFTAKSKGTVFVLYTDPRRTGGGDLGCGIFRSASGKIKKK